MGNPIALRQTKEKPLSIRAASPLIDFSTRTVALSKRDLLRRRKLAPLAAERKVPFSELVETPSMVRPHLILTNQCNMACTYCFATEGTYGRDRAAMKTALATKIPSFAERLLSEGTSVMLLHFGGEPLLNFQVMRQILFLSQKLTEKYGRSRFYHAVVTNGIGITREIADFLVNNEIKLVLSLDGRQKVHDKVRRMKNGRGSFQRAIAGLSYLPQSYPITIRATISYWTDVPKELEFFRSLGASEIEFGYLGEYPPNVNVAERLGRQLHQLFEYALFKNDPSCIGRVLPFATLMKQVHRFAYNEEYSADRYCGAGSTRLAITPDGSILPCHAFYSLDNWREWTIGDVSHGINQVRRVKFLKKIYAEKKCCESCFHRIICSGPCLGKLFTSRQSSQSHCYTAEGDTHSVTGITQSVFLYWYCKLREHKPVFLQKILEGN